MILNNNNRIPGKKINGVFACDDDELELYALLEHKNNTSIGSWGSKKKTKTQTEQTITTDIKCILLFVFYI
jgi:hypothetical protein